MLLVVFVAGADDLVGVAADFAASDFLEVPGSVTTLNVEENYTIDRIKSTFTLK
jgi:hypothetical protein